MSDFLKINRIGQILEIVLDPPKAVNRVEEFESAMLLDSKRWEGKMMTPRGVNPDELLLASAQYPDKPRCSIESLHVYTSNQFEHTEK
jgi:hypothetical protein